MVTEAEISPSVLQDRVLLQAHVKARSAKLLLRLSLERKLITENLYFNQAERLIEIEKMISGWRKSLVGRK